MKFVFSFMLLLVLCSVSLVAENRFNDLEVMVVISEINTRSYSSVISELTEVYYFTEELIIAGVESLELLEEKNLNYSIIDKKLWSSSYYLISAKRGEALEFNNSWGDLLYNDGKLMLFKGEELKLEQITAIPYSFTELRRYPLSLNTVPVPESPTERVYLWREEVAQLVQEINPDSLAFFVRKLEDFETRYFLAENRNEVVDWIYGEFSRFGYQNVVVDSFRFMNTWQKNVSVTVNGHLNPDQVVVIGGHYDSIISQHLGDPRIVAPGADDNASGTAAVLEIARAMKQLGFQPETTIRFITYAAEEVGLNGSHYDSEKALNNGENIKLMINNDMIGYTPDPEENWKVQLIEYRGAENYAEFSRGVIREYTSITPITTIYNANFSDSYPYWTRGFPAIYFAENNWNPHYHSPDDISFHLNFEYATEIVRAMAAIATLINDVPDKLEGFTATDVGNGSELILNWNASVNPNHEFYKIHVGNSSGSYHSSYSTVDNSFVLTGLETGMLYYIGLQDVSNQEYGSQIAEVSGIPHIIPRTPQDFRDIPTADTIMLQWSANSELDLAGYYLYRSTVPGEIGDLLVQEAMIEESFADIQVEGGVYYYYTLKAVDNDGNVSQPSSQIRSRLLTMEDRVLVVDDTPDGSGIFQNPTKEDVLEFIENLLEGYEPEIYPLWDVSEIKLADMGGYSTVIWLKNNSVANPYPDTILAEIGKYLDNGGNLIFSGYFPGRLFSNNSSYPMVFSAGDFFYDYLKVSQVEIRGAARFRYANPLFEHYPQLTTEESLTPENINYHLINIESIEAAETAQNIYTYLSGFPEGNPATVMNGLPVGTGYFGDDYAVVTLSFPLYYMEVESAREFIEFVIENHFRGGLEIAEDYVEPSMQRDVVLQQNYPNPFNPETTISFSLSKATEVNLSIYNLKGQLVNTLVAEYRTTGNHQYVWKGTDHSGKSLASGIYFYVLRTDRARREKRMLLIK